MKAERPGTKDDFARACAVLRAALCREVEGTAVRHPNGFTKVPLGKNSDGQRLFLHAWENAATDSQIHDHRWGFTSIVLAGRLVNTTYDLDVCESSDMRGALIAAYSSDGATFALDPIGGRTVVAVERARSIMVWGARYSQDPMELHRVAGAAGTVTLVARGRHVKPIARVLLSRDQGPSRQEFTPVASAERDTLIRSVLQQIA